jgi:hypothetical protein
VAIWDSSGMLEGGAVVGAVAFGKIGAVSALEPKPAVSHLGVGGKGGMIEDEVGHRVGSRLGGERDEEG